MSTDRILSVIVAVVFGVLAAYVETHGGDPKQYLAVATAGFGYYVGHAVQKSRNKKS